MFKVQPWMLGVGVVALGGVGIAVYEVVQSKKSPAQAAALPVGAQAPAAPAIPLIAVYRPALAPPGNVFSQTNYPVGPVVNLVSGATVMVTPAAQQHITLVLPSGCKWLVINVGNQANPSVVLGRVQLSVDLLSPVSLPVNSLTGSNVIAAAWIDSKGAQHASFIGF